MKITLELQTENGNALAYKLGGRGICVSKLCRYSTVIWKTYVGMFVQVV